MTYYYAQLGNTPNLSFAELNALLASSPVLLEPTLVKLQTDKSPSLLGDALGGTTKLIKPLTPTSVVKLTSDLTTLIHQLSHKNVAITSLVPDLQLSQTQLHDIKKEVSQTKPIRFLSLKTSGHSLVALRKQHIAEFVILKDNGVLTLGQTAWIQDADDWANRDRDKPYRDIKKGMLPPKVARIMVNLACQGQSNLSLVDPFCGTGTILLEAALSQISALFGSDVNNKAVLGAKQNLTWLANNYNLPPINSKFELVDATHLDERLSSVDVIVTEPYMGPLLDSHTSQNLEKLKNTVKGLSKLYTGALKSWHKIISDQGRVVISIPSFLVQDRQLFTLTVDDYARLGYNYISSVAYSKPGATVIRNITILTKT